MDTAVNQKNTNLYNKHAKTEINTTEVRHRARNGLNNIYKAQQLNQQRSKCDDCMHATSVQPSMRCRPCKSVSRESQRH